MQLLATLKYKGLDIKDLNAGHRDHPPLPQECFNTRFMKRAVHRLGRHIIRVFLRTGCQDREYNFA